MENQKQHKQLCVSVWTFHTHDTEQDDNDERKMYWREKSKKIKLA